MATIERKLLSGSTNGKPIPVAATATPGTTIHTAVGSTAGVDEVWLYAANVTGSSQKLTLEWGGVSDPSDHAVKALSIAANSGPTLVAAGLPLNNGLVVKAFSDAASALNITGWVNRIQ